MDTRDVDAIRNTINMAKLQEQKTDHLHHLLQQQLPQLHNAIQLPEEDSVSALADFVTRYIEHVPDFIEAIEHLTEQAGLYEHASVFLKIAKDYFLQPPTIVEGHSGMDALMDEAYLAHRLMEEINDRFIGRCGIPLAPMDMTRSNLIIHHLIGEPFANELDMAVQYSVELLMNQDKVFSTKQFQQYAEEHRHRGWAEELERWPCLAGDLAINLNFSEPTPQALH
jgi:hypothetical protein